MLQGGLAPLEPDKGGFQPIGLTGREKTLHTGRREALRG